MNAAADLLRMLAPGNSAGVRAPGPQDILRRLASGDSFQSVLDKARTGGISSGIPVTTAPGAQVTLTPDQASRLAAAADMAEAHGAGRAVFLIDGQALRMDVGSRTILGAVDASQTGVLTDIDAIINVAQTGASQSSGIVGPPAAMPPGLNLSLLRALSRDGSGNETRAA